MSLPCFRYMYGRTETPYWPGLRKGEAIPDDCKSRLADPSRRSKTAPGTAHALGALLSDSVTLGRSADTLSARYKSSSTSSGSPGSRFRVATSEPATSGGSSGPGVTRRWHGTDSMQGVVFLSVLEAMLLGGEDGPLAAELEEVRERWLLLLEEMEVATGHPAPYDPSKIAQAAGSTPCMHAAMALSDAIYFMLKHSAADGTRAFLEDPGSEVPGISDTDRAHLFDLPTADSQAAPVPVGRLTRTLTALFATGGTALLIGPTSTFKTTAAKRAVYESGAALVTIGGRPGIEDRDFFGTVAPTPDGPAWIDGPVTEAFRQAQRGPTVLLIDELLRLETVYLGAFVALLDPASPEELAARDIDPVSGRETEWHYVASLPTGEHVACPCPNLSLVATTNIGQSYAQTSILGDALRGRFELTIEVEEADPDIRRHLYVQEGGPQVADLLEAIEAFTAENTLDRSGILERKAHARLMLGMARHLKRLRDHKGLPEREAALQALEDCVISYCVQRTPGGLLDDAGRQLLRDEGRRLIDRHL